MDFVFPGRLGVLPTFEQHFAVPIRLGGLGSASEAQAQRAYHCAKALKGVIAPYILRRTKEEVLQAGKRGEEASAGSGGTGLDHLRKTERVLLCHLTPAQIQAYHRVLQSDLTLDVTDVATRPRAQDGSGPRSGRGNGFTAVVFRVIGKLCKICNHPDLLGTGKDRTAEAPKSPDYGATQRSGKLLVLQKVLLLWRKEGHRTLVFSKTRQMLQILENFVQSLGLSYCRMDGSTPVRQRQAMVQGFNNGKANVFLLTTKVGGVGVNLVGADRVIIFEPDWNPATDMQVHCQTSSSCSTPCHCQNFCVSISICRRSFILHLLRACTTQILALLHSTHVHIPI